MLNIYFYIHLLKINIFSHFVGLLGIFLLPTDKSLLHIFKHKKQRVSELLHLSFKITLKIAKNTVMYFIFTSS